MKKRQLSASVAIVALLTMLFALVPGGATAAKCVPATNIEAIIDDSGSMSGTDSNNNRTEAIKLLLAKSGNANKTLGAVEFGSASSYQSRPAATTLWAPAKIGPSAASMHAILDANIKDDHGSTDYNAAFAKAATDNPSANARIFLTDGGHNEGAYTNGHQGGPPTYVIGLGVFGTDDTARLQAIANETGGRYFGNVTTGNLNATMNQVDAALNCQRVGKTFTDTFTKARQSKRKKARVGSKTKSMDILLSWENPLDKFTIGSVKLDKAGRGKNPKVKIKKKSGKTYLLVRVTKLKRGTLSFKLRARTISPTSFGGVTLTTQATPSKRR